MFLLYCLEDLDVSAPATDANYLKDYTNLSHLVSCVLSVLSILMALCRCIFQRENEY